MRRREKVRAGLLGALWMVSTVVLIQVLLEQPMRIIPLGIIGALSFLLVWILTTPVVRRRRRFD